MALQIREHRGSDRPLTSRRRVLLALFCLIAGSVMFILAYIGMRQNSGLGALNQPVLDWMLAHRSADIIQLAKYITNLASPIYLALATGLFVIIWALVKREFWRPFTLVMAIVTSALTSFILKLLVKDARPPIANMVPAFELDYSFPSGHTISIVVLLLVMGYLIYSRRFSYFRLICWGIGTVVVGSAIAVSRLYLGYHWLTDVVASAGLGFVILALFVVIDTIVSRKIN